MNTNNIEINTQSSIKIKLNKIIYFDPFKISKEVHDADIIFITHNHYDHFDIDSINNIKNDETIVIAPKSIESDINKISFKKYYYLEPFDEIVIDDLSIKGIRAYNIDKPFHPKDNNWLGYLVTCGNITYYVAGDTDVTSEVLSIKCDIALIPIGGHFTMDVNEASDLIKTISPKVVIPTHYGSIIGDNTLGKKLKEYLSDSDIEVVEKLF